jgi:hypothetical protein
MKCEICYKPATDKHHIKTRGSAGTDDDWNLLSLCRLHHSEIHRIGTNRMILKYSHLKEILAKKGWEVVSEFNVNKLRRIND